MKTAFNIKSAGSRAFTLAELMIGAAIFLMLITGLLSCYLYSLRISMSATAKMAATDDARQSMTLLLQDIRSADTIMVGTGSLTSFTQVADYTNQVGTALQIYPTQDTNNWVRYFYQPQSNALCRTEDGITAVDVTANSVTNTTPFFTLENSFGTISQSRQLNPVVEINISFTKLKNPSVMIGPGNYFDFYHYQTRIASRINQ